MNQLLQKLKAYTKKDITESQLKEILNRDELVLLSILRVLGKGEIVFCPHKCNIEISFPDKKTFIEFLKQEKIIGVVKNIDLTESEFEELRRFISIKMWANAYYDKKRKTLRMTTGY